MGAFVLMVHLQAKPEHREKFMQMALENAAAARSTEAGCQQFDVVVTIAVKKALVEIDCHVAGQLFGRVHLALAKTQWPQVQFKYGSGFDYLVIVFCLLFYHACFAVDGNAVPYINFEISRCAC